jgi:hypothetical protein
MQNVMTISINETSKAFNVNGVPFAKRHLVNTLSKNSEGDLQKMLAKFLVIVPFLATSYTPHDDANESIKYGAIKAKRLYKALGITEDNTVPFMLVALAQAGEDIPGVSQSIREAGFYESGEVDIKDPSFSEGRVSQAQKPTLH